MDPGTFVATCAAVIALLSLVVTILQVRATQAHNRKSVRPVLQIGNTFHLGEQAGLLLSNVGLGPARIVSSRLQVDDRVLGEFCKDSIDQARAELQGQRRPRATTFQSGAFLAVDYLRFLLSVDDYDPASDAEFAHLVRDRLTLEFVYESLYGGERFVLRYPARERDTRPT